jgi:hypothetical protein
MAVRILELEYPNWKVIWKLKIKKGGEKGRKPYLLGSLAEVAKGIGFLLPFLLCHLNTEAKPILPNAVVLLFYNSDDVHNTKEQSYIL